MTEESPSYLQAGCTTARGDRMVTASLVCTQGVADLTAGGLLVTDGPTGLQVLVAAGAAFVEGTEIANQGMYHVFNDASKTITAAAADPTDDRIDLVVARVYDSEYSGALDEWRIEFVTGTPSPSPAPPALPDNSLVLAQVLVQNGATTLAPGDITDARENAEICSDLGAGLSYLGSVVYDEPFAELFEKADYPDMKAVFVRVQAGGGAGGGAHTTSGGESCSGSGGTSGGYDEKWFTRDDLLASETVEPGAGGVPVSGDTGGTGGDSDFGSHLHSEGGVGGAAMAAGAGTAFSVAANPPGATGDGTVSIGGRAGGNAMRLSANDALSGKGGDSPLGRGGRALTNASAVGIAGENGGGGGGAVNMASQADKVGGLGGNGLVIIDLYG